MTEQINLEEAMQKVKAILDQSKMKKDQDIWVLACAMVAIAGVRAHNTNQPEIEQVCKDFVEGMHEHTGTPALKETAQ